MRRTMEVVRFADATFYTAPDHDDVVARRLQGGDATTAFALVGHSTFAPGAGVPMGAAPVGKVYVVTAGELTIVAADGTRHVLGVMDSIHMPPHEARAVVNDGRHPAAMIVVTPGDA